MPICADFTALLGRTASALRRTLALIISVIGLVVGLAYGDPARAFGFDDVAAQAQAQAQHPYQTTSRKPPAELQALNYDQYRDIRFRPEHAVWRADKLPFELMFFHLGKFQTEPVRINEVTLQGVRHLRYRSSDFDYGRNKLSPDRWGDVGFAGFRAHYALNGGQYKDELVVFLGASYFRALGAGQHYGLSARGLAIDTVGGQAEEFPRFSEFWIVKPADAKARALTVFALLDSPRASGAYQFDIQPGIETVMNVRSRLFLRAGVATLGIAPLTSMFAFGENQPHQTDFRPEVHDSDGLMIATGEGEWLWRPLLNPKATLTTAFSMRDLRGFGLMQRDRNFSSYEDSEARYELRPSAWIEPIGSWGPGRVELVQLSTPDETNDNIVAYWVPAQLPATGQPFDFSYRLHWQGQQMQRPPGGWAVQTRIGHGFAELGSGEQQYIVDFMGPSLDSLPADTAMKAMVSAPSNGQIMESNAYRVAATGAWRMTIRVKQLRSTEPTELRGYLQSGSDILTETWSNILPAQ